MAEFDWFKIKFLESAQNLKAEIKKAIDREPSTSQAEEIAACLQQGRLFFSTANNSSIEIRPLQIFYGMTSFAKALVLARNLIGHSSLDQSHGVKDVSSGYALDELTLKVGARGTFQHFNDTVSKLSVIRYYDKNLMKRRHEVPTCQSSELQDYKISIKEIFSRIPGLEEMYSRTFKENAKCCALDLVNYAGADQFRLRFDDPELFHDRASLEDKVKRMRSSFPFLKDWTLMEASNAFDNSILNFENVLKDDTAEFAVDVLVEVEANNFNNQIYGEMNPKNIEQLTQPFTHGLGNSEQSVIQPYKDQYISEYSLQFMGMFLLSSLVRYRPQVWSSSIMGTSSSRGAGDTRCLALIEMFMDICMREFPDVVVNGISYRAL